MIFAAIAIYLLKETWKNKNKFLDFNVFTKHTRSLVERFFQTTKQLCVRVQRTTNTVNVYELGIQFQSTDQSQCY